MVFIGIMIFIMVFITMVQLIGPIKDEIGNARSVNSLDCGNSSITVGQKATCIVVDWTLFQFVGVTLAAAAATIGGGIVIKKVTSKE